MKSDIASESQKAELAKLKAKSRAVYRKQYYEKNKEKENAKNRERYYAKYKCNPEVRKRKLEYAKQYRLRKLQECPTWEKERRRKYSKPYSKLSPSARSKIREACRKWTEVNWNRRVEYARIWRRKNPAFGFRAKIASARRSGDIGKLAQECLDAIVRTYDRSSERQGQSSNS